MTGITISSAITLPIYAYNLSLDPVSITGTGAISVGAGELFAISNLNPNTNAAFYSPISVYNDGAVTNTSGGWGVHLTGGGSVTNGSETYTGATITGGVAGVFLSAGPSFGASTISNDGTIIATKAYGGTGADEVSGGIITNGSNTDTTATIEGDRGVFAGYDTTGHLAESTVTNYGTIESASFATHFKEGVDIDQGILINGSTADTTALITAASTGVLVQREIAASSNPGVANYGTIQAGLAVETLGGVNLYNGAEKFDTSASIIGTTKDAISAPSGSGVTNIYNFGTIASQAGGAFSGIYLYGAGTVANYGTISGVTNAIQFSGSYANVLQLYPGSSISGQVNGDVSGARNQATLEVVGLKTGNSVSGIGTQFVNFGTINLHLGVHQQISGNATGLGVTITGFKGSDQIDVQGIGLAQSAVANGNALSLYSGAGGTGTKLFTFPSITNSFGAPLNPANLTLSSDGAPGGTVIACYREGTQIRTPRGDRPIETLFIGDTVLTAAGRAAPIRWIGRRTYTPEAVASDPAALAPIRIARFALGHGLPTRALEVSPEHAMLIDGVLIAARHLVNNATITRSQPAGPVRYLHIELAEHDIILAEGAPSETFVDADSRHAFDNAAEFARLSTSAAPSWQFCAPRIEHGEILADIRHRLARHAGLPTQDWRTPTPQGPLIGNLERLQDGIIEGWAQDPSAPERPVQLDITINGTRIAATLANRYRNDLESAGLGTGRHAFRLQLPTLPEQPTRIEVTRTADQTPLPGSPILLPQSSPPA